MTGVQTCALPISELGRDAEPTLVLPAVEEEQQGGHDPDREDDRVHARPEIARDPERLEAPLDLRDEVGLRRAGGADAGVDPDDDRERPAREPAQTRSAATGRWSPARGFAAKSSASCWPLKLL